MMAVDNSFHFIGVCYGDSRVKKSKNGVATARFILSVGEGDYIPIVAKGLEAERTTYLCRNGNKIAVSGIVMTKHKVNVKTGLLEIKIWFVCSSIHLISMPRKRILSDKKLKKITDIYCPEEHTTEGNTDD